MFFGQMPGKQFNINFSFVCRLFLFLFGTPTMDIAVVYQAVVHQAVVLFRGSSPRPVQWSVLWICGWYG